MVVFLCLNTKEDILKNVENQTVDWLPLASIVFSFLLWKSKVSNNHLVTYQHSSTEERNSYRFGTAREWV